MFTYQIVGLSSENGRTYECEYGTYSKDDGFKLNEKAKTYSKEMLLDIFFNQDMWKIKKEVKKMTKADIEKALGYEIEIDGYDEKNDSKKTYKLTDKQADDLKNALKDYLGFWW